MRNILLHENAIHPYSQPQDYIKLIFQSEFGPGHLIADASYSKKRMSTFEYIADITAAVKLSKISVSAFVNYYSSQKANVNLGLTLGWFLFNERFIE